MVCFEQSKTFHCVRPGGQSFPCMVERVAFGVFYPVLEPRLGEHDVQVFAVKNVQAQIATVSRANALHRRLVLGAPEIRECER